MKNKTEQDFEFVMEKLIDLYSDSDGISLNAFSSAIANMLIRVSVACHQDDEEDFRIKLRTMYESFVDIKKTWDEVKHEFKDLT